MGKKTKIDWCDSSWNPVTGCEHGCPYCYARGIAERFGTNWLPDENPGTYECVLDGTETHAIIELYGMQARRREDGKIAPAPYPLGFTPTLHRYKLDEPQRWKKSKTIFVCSMADLFGAWGPDEWIQEVFEACRKAPQHRYLFLTKNPERYDSLAKLGYLPAEGNFWFGSSIPTPEMPYFYDYRTHRVNTFVSIEPLHEEFGPWEFDKPGKLPRWIIIGAETGNRKGKIVPEKAWVDEIAWQAKRNNIPVFMKESLRALMGADFRQEFPWEV